jgi:hypothetical protein
MTPKEKAEELYNKVYGQTPTRWTELEIEEDKRFAKQCALIAVDELIENHNKMKDFLFSEIGYLITSPDYWQEVKQEIKNI